MRFKPINSEVYNCTLRHELARCKTNCAVKYPVSRIGSEKVLADTLKIGTVHLDILKGGPSP